jgi:hypothetical protein
MKANLKDFIRDGAFGPIQVGMSRADVEEHLGAPEDWEAKARGYQKADIWKYDSIEFYFEDDALWMIFLDDFDAPAGEHIELDSWIINGQLTRAQAEEHLAAEGISHRKEAFPYNENGVHLVAGTGTVLAFSGLDAEHPSLHSMHRRLKL